MAAERDIDDLPRNDANYTALTPLWFLERAALTHPARASIVHGPVRYTWADTYSRCRRLALVIVHQQGCALPLLLLLLLLLPPVEPPRRPEVAHGHHRNERRHF